MDTHSTTTTLCTTPAMCKGRQAYWLSWSWWRGPIVRLPDLTVNKALRLEVGLSSLKDSSSLPGYGKWLPDCIPQMSLFFSCLKTPPPFSRKEGAQRRKWERRHISCFPSAMAKLEETLMTHQYPPPSVECLWHGDRPLSTHQKTSHPFLIDCLCPAKSVGWNLVPVGGYQETGSPGSNWVTKRTPVWVQLCCNKK